MKEYGAEQSVRRIGHAPSGAVELLCARPAVAAAVGVGSKAGGGAVDLAVYTGAVLDSLSTPSRTFSLSLSLYIQWATTAVRPGRCLKSITLFFLFVVVGIGSLFLFIRLMQPLARHHVR